MRSLHKKSQHSYKNNRARKNKGALFKKGVFPNYNCSHVRCVEKQVQDSIPLNSDPDLESVVRLGDSVANDVLNACNRSRDPLVLPFKLRPRQTVPQSEKQSANISDNENIIVNISQLGNIFKCIGNHSCDQPSLDYNITDRKGLCVDIKVLCHNCDFCSDEIPLYTSIPKKHGKPLGVLNISLLLPVLCSKLGISDLQLLLACLNIQAPDKRGMQRKLNTVADQVEDMGRRQLVKNQEYVRHISNLAGCSGETDVEFDVAYTSRPQAGCDTATQVFAPVIEKTTSKHLPVDLHIGNKLCSKPNCNHLDRSCKKNYCDETSINQAEAIFVKKSLENIKNQNILKVKSVTTDGSASLAKAMREHNAKVQEKVQHFKCFIHNMRNLHKHLRSACIKQPKGMDRLWYCKKLATAIRNRVRLELTRLRKLLRGDELYLDRAREAVTNVLDCFSGSHDSCKHKSVVCTAHLKGHSTRYLPYGKNVVLSAADKQKLQKVLDKYCGVQQLRDTVQLHNTNRCENMYRRLFSYAPKSMVWKRSFTALCYSATLGASVGRGLSLLQLAERCGINIEASDPMYRYAMFTQNIARYHSDRKQKHEYKTSRYLSHRKRANRAVLSQSLYKAPSKVTKEHDYGINLGN